MSKPPAVIRLLYLLLAFVPLALSPLLVLLLAEGWLNAGGGEKDVLLVLPYLIWTLVFFVGAAIQIMRGQHHRVWVARAASWSTLTLFVLALGAFMTSLLGVA